MSSECVTVYQLTYCNINGLGHLRRGSGLLEPEDEATVLLQNVGNYISVSMA